MRIGILNCGHLPDEVRAEFGDYDDLYAQLLAGRGLTFQTFQAVDMDIPNDPLAADGWLISGSRHGAYEDLPFIPPLEEFLRSVAASDRPMVGICFGHQIIAQALGGRVEKYAGGWSVGRVEYGFEAAGPLALNAWHQDQVITPPEGARTIATAKFCRHAGLVYPGGTILSVQPHPEFDEAVVRGIYDARRDALNFDAKTLGGLEGGYGKTLDNARLAAIIADHFHAHAPAETSQVSHA